MEILSFVSAFIPYLSRMSTMSLAISASLVCEHSFTLYGSSSSMATVSTEDAVHHRCMCYQHIGLVLEITRECLCLRNASLTLWPLIVNERVTVGLYKVAQITRPFNFISCSMHICTRYTKRTTALTYVCYLMNL